MNVNDMSYRPQMIRIDKSEYDMIKSNLTIMISEQERIISHLTNLGFIIESDIERKVGLSEALYALTQSISEQMFIINNCTTIKVKIKKTNVEIKNEN